MKDSQMVTQDRYGFVLPVWKVDKSDRSSLENEIAKAMWEEDRSKLLSLAPCNCQSQDDYQPTCKARSWDGCKGQRGGDMLYQEAKYRAAYEVSAAS